MPTEAKGVLTKVPGGPWLLRYFSSNSPTVMVDEAEELAESKLGAPRARARLTVRIWGALRACGAGPDGRLDTVLLGWLAGRLALLSHGFEY